MILTKEGPGRLYYRLGLRYAPRDLDLAPADYRFTVLRTYEAVDDPPDVRQDAAGVWHVKAKSRVRVKLTLVAPPRRCHVARVDPLPAILYAGTDGGGVFRTSPILAPTPTPDWRVVTH